MDEVLSKFREVERILAENEQLHRRVGYLEVQNHKLWEELRRTSLQLEWIATVARERSGPAGERREAWGA